MHIHTCTPHCITSCIQQVHDILQRIQYGKDDDQVGIARLISNRTFAKGFPLHDVRNVHVFVVYTCVLKIFVIMMHPCPSEHLS